MPFSPISDFIIKILKGVASMFLSLLLELLFASGECCPACEAVFMCAAGADLSPGARPAYAWPVRDPSRSGPAQAWTALFCPPLPAECI